ncbi:hypothetical protein OGAPHI_005621 [Ogataea philodendri]|uniref:DNA ligase n=1 Tax=Ogataea philodendri TaxID=1378263 RepID=A0A9P8P0E5_9ASCO|nr:uncharacterized protein OGAPHI_005621 [Ogataea philodendri]KAH3662369.1 hypothetical protein OGAPHI_005621 [Ogataea philodendri]
MKSTQKQQTLARFFGSQSSQSTAAKKRSRSPTPESSNKVLKSDDTPKTSADELEDAKELLKMEPDVKVPDLPVGKPIPYSKLCEVFEALENEPGRLKCIEIASELFTHVLSISETQEDQIRNLVEVNYLTINRVSPDYEGLELGLGETLLMKALASGTGRSMQQLKEDMGEYGDIGLVAQKSRSKQSLMFKPKPLTVSQVFNNLKQIAGLSGSSSQNKKLAMINKMLTSCDSREAKFLMRSLEGSLRIQFAEKSVVVALAKALAENEMRQKGKKINPDVLAQADEQIKEAFSQVPNHELIIETAIKYGVLNLMDHCTLKPGIPVKPMLAKPTKSITEILDQFENQEFTCEYKYDGERAQVHLLPDGTLRVYSRSSENMTQRYPDLIPVVEELKRLNPGVESFILDCECVAWDKKQEKILPFQILSTRKRKDVKEEDITVQVCLFAFDILLYNGESLIKMSLKERREYMYDNLKVIPGKFRFSEKLDSSDLDVITKFLDQSVKDACEGLMIKTLNGQDSLYEPSKRSRNWLKLKKDYLEGVGDSLDLVVIGAYVGKGKRTGGYGGFLLASYNTDTGEYEAICKIGTGFSDEMFATLTEKLKPTEVAEPKGSIIYDKTSSRGAPEIWFEPTMLFEVKVADFTESPVYKAGASLLGDGSKGVSLRFPRFIRIRDDKALEDATSSEQIVELYEKQANLN